MAPVLSTPSAVDVNGVSAPARAGQRRTRRTVLVAMVVVAAAAAVSFVSRLLRSPLNTARVMLAVLPFHNLNQNPEEQYFADGMTEEMITQLGGLDPEHLGVIARTSAMRYKASSKDAVQVARELGVTYLLEGGVRRQGQRIRVTAQLIHASDQTNVWADSYERDASDVLKVQSEVSIAIDPHQVRNR